MSPVRQPEATRLKILEAAVELFHAFTFTGTSVNQIVERAGITKGALFHHFKGKNELGYAVVDELLRQQFREEWVKPLQTSVDPVADIQAILDGFSEEMQEDPKAITRGCPINNLAQEMSAVDDTFRLKLKDIFQEWEQSLERAIRAGIDAGNVRSDVDPSALAVTLVALFEGSIGMLKVSQDTNHFEKLDAGLTWILQSLRP